MNKKQRQQYKNEINNLLNANATLRQVLHEANTDAKLYKDAYNKEHAVAEEALASVEGLYSEVEALERTLQRIRGDNAGLNSRNQNLIYARSIERQAHAEAEQLIKGLQVALAVVTVTAVGIIAALVRGVI